MTDPHDRDTRIAAFIDGALDDAALAEFEAEMAADPALAAEVERIMANDALLRAAFAGPLDQGVDDVLLARMGLLEAGPQGDTVAPFKPAAAPLPQAAPANDDTPGWHRWRLPLGAGVAAALVLAVISAIPRGDAAPGLAMALDDTPSGQAVALDSGIELRPTLTFAAADGRWCREFAVGSGADGGTGVACRDAGGGWQVEALQGGAVELASGQRVVLAAGAAGSGLNAAYDRLGAGDPLSAARENELISNVWEEE